MPSSKRKRYRRITVRRSDIHGKGVFAAATIPKGTRIIEYKGRRIDDDAADALYCDDTNTHTFLFMMDNDTIIDGSHQGNSSRWINHSCEPNCVANEIDGRLYIDALRTLEFSEEVTIDYNLYMEERYTPALKKLYGCRCGTENCRGTMLGSKR